MSLPSDHRVRQRLLESAAELLAQQGWKAGLLDRAAAVSQCSLESAQVFFQRDEDLVLALYSRLALGLEDNVSQLPDDALAERFAAAVKTKWALADPYRDALASLMAVMLDPRSELGVSSPQMEIIRARVQAVFEQVAAGAKPLPGGLSSQQWGRLLYGLHLLLMLAWSQDRSADRQAAEASLEWAREMIAAGAGMMFPLSPARKLARRGAEAAEQFWADEDPAVEQTAEAILKTLYQHRRLLATDSSCARQPCERCLAWHLPRVKYFVRVGLPLHMLLPAFPAKSPSRRKTLGPLPDRAERNALEFLQTVCQELHQLHPPGVRLTICSDGHVFGDLVEVGDEDVTAYGRAIDEIIAAGDLHYLDTFSMSELYDRLDFPAMRSRLENHYAEPTETLQRRLNETEAGRILFNGIHRFLFEEFADLRPQQSRTQIRKQCKPLAAEVIRRSDAWGRLLADCFPAALRLSIHPQAPHSAKIGILLGPSDDVWLTPWHASAVKSGDTWRLMKRDQAEELGARLALRHGRPDYLDLTEEAS